MIQGWVLRWLLNVAAIIITAIIIPAFDVTWWAAIVGSVFLGIINAFIRPLLLLLTLPLNILSLGLFTLVINGFTLWLTAVTIEGFDIHGFGWAIISALMITVISFIISSLVNDNEYKFR